MLTLTQKEALLLQTGGHHTQQNLNWNRHEDTAHRRVGTLHIQMEGFLSDVDTEIGGGTPHKILRKSLVVGWGYVVQDNNTTLWLHPSFKPELSRFSA